MKNRLRTFLKYLLIFLIPFCISFSFFFGAYPVIQRNLNENQISNEDKFINELKNINTYSIKDANLTLYKVNNRLESKPISDVYNINLNININPLDSLDIKTNGRINIKYSNAKGINNLNILDTNFTYLDKNIYFDNFGLVYNKPIYFNLDNFYNLFDNFAYQLPESLNLNSFINCLSNIKEIKEANSDFVIYKTKTFLLNYNENKLVLRTDENYILNSIFTLANEDIQINDDYYLRVNITNIKKGTVVSVIKSSKDFIHVDNLMDSIVNRNNKIKMAKGSSININEFSIEYSNKVNINANNLRVDDDLNGNFYIYNPNEIKLSLTNLVNLSIKGDIRIYDDKIYFQSFLDENKSYIDLNVLSTEMKKNKIATGDLTYFYNKLNKDSTYSIINQINSNDVNTFITLNNNLENKDSYINFYHQNKNLTNINVTNFVIDDYIVNSNLILSETYNDFKNDYNNFNKDEYIDKTDILISLLISCFA